MRSRRPNWIQPSYLLEEPFTAYEATELVNLINPGRPIVSNNFLQIRRIRGRSGLKRAPKKKIHARPIA